MQDRKIQDRGLNNVNLNLLLVLRALLQTGSVTNASELIGRTPPSVSSSLSQLREILQDPLFIRVGNQLQPTTRAAQLKEPVEAAFRQINHIFETHQFDPQTSERVFTIVATDSLVASTGSRITRELRKRAPNMSVQFLGLNPNIADAMATREVDFAILPELVIDSLTPMPLSYQTLGKIEFGKVLMTKDHILAGRKSLQLEELVEFPHVGFSSNTSFEKQVKTHPLMNLKTAVSVSQTLTIPSLLEGTDMISIVVSDFAEYDIESRQLTSVPLKPTLTLDYGLVWSSVFERDEAHRWLRALTGEVMAN